MRNLHPFKRHIRPYTKEEFLRKYEDEGMTITELAVHFGIGRKKVQTDMAFFGVHARRIGKRDQSGCKNSSWKGGIVLDSKKKYRYRRMPDHPNACQNGYVAEHIVACCNKYAIPRIPPGFVVHHIDMDKRNNALDNLAMVSLKSHGQLHRQLELIAASLFKTGQIRFVEEKGYELCG
jgi:hypothetical protein